MAYTPDKTVPTASIDSDRVDPGRLPCGMKSFLGQVHTYGSGALYQNTDLAYYR